jgi:putative flippase GtrA
VPVRPSGLRGRIVGAIRWIRRPELGLLGQGIRYAMVGATVALISLTGTLVLAEAVGLPYEAAFAISYAVAIVTHFTLQRLFVWVHHEGFALPIHHQLVRYLPLTLTNYAIVAVAIAVLPHALGIRTPIVYVGATVVITVASFLLLRHGIFHAPAQEREQE